jgi:hypothetical protein
MMPLNPCGVKQKGRFYRAFSADYFVLRISYIDRMGLGIRVDKTTEGNIVF